MLALLLASLCLGAGATQPAAPAKPQLLSWNGKPTLCLSGSASVRSQMHQFHPPLSC